MASSLVPDLSLVMVALEHLKELDEYLKEEEVPFAPEASLHLVEITAAVSELEADKRAAREHLEVEIIENSKLRHQINNMGERMTKEIAADVAAARASNAEEIQQLCKDLGAVSQLQEEATEMQESLLSQNESLYLERDQAEADHDAVVATLNDLLALKYSSQVQLNVMWENIEELKSCVAGVERDGLTLEQNMKLERQASSVKRNDLLEEVSNAEERIEQQNHLNRCSRRELDSVTNKKDKTQGRLGELMDELGKVENNIRRLNVSRHHHEEQLEGEVQKQRELRQQRDLLKEELHELEEAFSLTVQNLQEEIVAMDGKIKEGRASKQRLDAALTQVCEVFKYRHTKENVVRAEHQQVSRELEWSRLQLEGRIASIIKHGREIKEMEEQVKELKETDVINKRLVKRNREELRGNMDAGEKNVGWLREEKERLLRLLEEAKRKRKEHIEKMTSDISSAQRRYEELLQEKEALLRQEPKTADASLLMRHVAQSKEEYERIESRQRQELQQLAADVDKVAQSVKEKQREVEEKEKILKKVEAEWSDEQSRHRRLEELLNELRKRRSELELSIQALKEKTSELLQPKEEMKAELEGLRTRHIDTLHRQASELRGAEVCVYDCGVKLEAVTMENSRLRFHISQMTEDVETAEQETHKYWQEAQKFRQDTEALWESLQQAWAEDLTLTQDHESSEGVLFVSISSLLDRLKNRKQQLGNISTFLHQQMLDFSKRLGDKTTAKLCS